MTISDIKKQWSRPRVGERVRLIHGSSIGEVVAVRNAFSVLRSMKEVDAMRFGPDIQARYGLHWMDIYYQADIIIKGNLCTVEPFEVESVLPPD